MNLLDTASLVVTPNGYKASKLYSIIPSDGSGDMTFARTGDTATRVNSSGLIETVLANKPRLDYLGSTCPKLLLEPQRTNLLNYSSEFGNGYWLKARGTLSDNVAVSPDGTTNADTLVSTSGQTIPPAIYLGSGTWTGNTRYSLSVFAKKLGDTNNLELAYVDNIAGYSGGKVEFNFETITTTIMQSANSSVTASMTSYGNGWYRCTISFLTIATPTYYYIGFTQLSFSTGNTFAFYGAQLEAGAYATSYIPTTTASVTRNVDVCSKTSATALIGQTEGTMFWDGIISNTGTNVIFDLNLNGTNDRFLEITTELAIRYIEYVNAIQASIATAINYVTLGNRYKIAAAYKANDFVLYVNGVQIGTDTSGTVFAADKVYNGYYTSGFQGLIKNNSIALWKTRLTNQELATLTSL